jgi:hypothetical protein
MASLRYATSLTLERYAQSVAIKEVKMRKYAQIACLVFLSGCGFSDQPADLLLRSDSAGVDVVIVLRAPADTVHLAAPAVRIGSTGIGGPEHEVFQLISDLALLPDGRVAIVDNRGARVAVFDSTGEWLYDIGGRGKGPGEYTSPILASMWGDTLFVWDALQRRLSHYSAAGVFLGSTVMPQRSSALPYATIADGYVMEVESGQLMDPAPARGALVRTLRDGSVVDTLVGPYPVPEYGWVITNQETGMGHMVNPPALEVYPSWTVGDGLLVWLDPISAAVEVRNLNTRRVERIVRLPYQAAPPTASVRDAYFRGLQAEFGIPDEVIARERTGTRFVELRPPVARVLVDDMGRVWVAEHDPSAFSRNYIGSRWDSIDVAQEQSSQFQFPHGYELKAVRGGRAYGITTLENGVHVADIFQLW